MEKAIWVNINQQKAVVAILISDKVDLRARRITADKYGLIYTEIYDNNNIMKNINLLECIKQES